MCSGIIKFDFKNWHMQWVSFEHTNTNDHKQIRWSTVNDDKNRNNQDHTSTCLYISA